MAGAGGATAAAGGLFHSKEMVIAGAVLGAPLVIGGLVTFVVVPPLQARANRRATEKAAQATRPEKTSGRGSSAGDRI